MFGSLKVSLQLLFTAAITDSAHNLLNKYIKVLILNAIVLYHAGLAVSSVLAWFD